MLDKGILLDSLHDHYEFHYSKIQEIDYSGDRPFLNGHDVLDAHYLICNFFLKKQEGIAGFGPKSVELLESAIGRQLASAGGSFIYNDIFDIASTLLIGLVANHPFHDGNKRTAFLSIIFFMQENNYTLSTGINEIEDFTVDVARFGEQNGRQIQVEDVSNRIRSLFRRMDKRIAYFVTYRELQSLLEQHGCSLRNPNGNYINVYRGEDRVAQVGFPDWNTEVSRNAISTIRKKTGLVPERGVDAQVFFKSADPLSALIGEYEGPLRRLANR